MIFSFLLSFLITIFIIWITISQKDLLKKIPPPIVIICSYYVNYYFSKNTTPNSDYIFLLCEVLFLKKIPPPIVIVRLYYVNYYFTKRSTQKITDPLYIFFVWIIISKKDPLKNYFTPSSNYMFLLCVSSISDND